MIPARVETNRGSKDLSLQFEVCQVDKMVMSASKLNDRGYDVVFPSSSGSEYGNQALLQKDGLHVPFVRQNGVLYMKVETQQEPESWGPDGLRLSVSPSVHSDNEDDVLIMAPVVDQELFEQMLVPFDQDAEEEHPVQYGAIDLDPPEEHILGPSQPPVPLTVPAAEVQLHLLSGHSDYKQWCTQCVQGRGQERAHQRKEAREGDVPVICAD